MTAKKVQRRSNCPICFGLDIFGDKWTLLVLRDLVFQRKRYFRELLASDEGIASNILSDRLKRLEAHGLVSRIGDPDDARQIVYRLTEKGIDLVPVLVEIAYWSAKHHPHTGAPKSFVKAFERDRQVYIQDIVSNLKN